MKVLHVIPAVAARYGGPSQAVFGTTRALAEQGAVAPTTDDFTQAEESAAVAAART